MAEQNGWRTIDSAPRDGTEFLGCFDWIEGGQRTVAKFKRNRRGEGYFAPPFSHVPHNFTHWHPLPQAKEPHK